MIEEEKIPSASSNFKSEIQSDTSMKPGMITQKSNLTTAQYIELDQINECDSQHENMSMSQVSFEMIDTSSRGFPYIHSKTKFHYEPDDQWKVKIYEKERGHEAPKSMNQSR